MPRPPIGEIEIGIVDGCGREQCEGDEVGGDLVLWDGEEEKAPARVVVGS